MLCCHVTTQNFIPSVDEYVETVVALQIRRNTLAASLVHRPSLTIRTIAIS